MVVSDNLKAGVTKACFCEPAVSRTYAEMAAHYDTAVVPARPYKPRDKAKIEVAVHVATRWIIAKLRNRRFFSLAKLSERRGRSINRPTTIMRRPKRASSFSPSTALPAAAPAAAPTTPAPAKTSAHGHLTVCARAWPRRPSGAGGNRDGAGANCPMGRTDTDDVEQKRDGEDRPAATDKAEREADRGAGQDRQRILEHGFLPEHA